MIFINNMKIHIKNTFLTFETMAPNVGMIKSSSCSNMAEMEEQIKQGKRCALNAMNDIFARCDTDTGGSSGELGSMESESISRRRPWDEYSIEDALSPSDCGDAMEGDNHADSTFAELNDEPQITHPCHWPQNMEVSTNWFPETIWPHRICYTYENPSQMLGRVPYGVGPQDIVPPGPHTQQFDQSLEPNNTESTRLRRPAGAGSSKKKGDRRKRRNRWVYENRKNRVTLLVDPWNGLPTTTCIEHCIGTNGDRIKALTEGYDGAFVRVDEAAYPCIRADGSSTLTALSVSNAISPLMRIQISAPYVDSFLKCRRRTLKWIYALFPDAVVSESEEGTVIKSLSMRV